MTDFHNPAATRADVRLLVAVADATLTEEWTTAAQVAFLYDGRASAAGIWARRLWDQEAAGFLEQRFASRKNRWRLTDKGVAAIFDSGWA